jgi:glycosyltransferase involved in cell wall biosynthesis
MRESLAHLRVAVVHDWLVTYAGAERVLEAMLRVLPQAELYSLIDFLPEGKRGFILDKPVTTSFIQRLPFAKSKYRQYLPLMPLAVEQFDLSSYDLVVSSSYAVAKGVLTGPDQLHLSMCYSPIRYAWDLHHQYLRESGLERGVKGWLSKWLLHRMRLWDARTANGVDEFIAISHFIARRVWKVYRRESTVIYPPIDVEGFEVREAKEDFYLTASRLVPYKRVDLIVEAFTRMPQKRLVVIGEGPEFKKIKARASANVTLLGYQPFAVLKDHMQRAKAFVFAAEEDFGIVPLEAQACGTPVIAFGKGGALETLRGMESERPTAVFFDEQTVEALCQAVDDFERSLARFRPRHARENALRFSGKRFEEEFGSFVEAKWLEFERRKTHRVEAEAYA